MHVPREPNPLSGTAHRAASGEREPIADAACLSRDHVYDLRRGNLSSDCFYAEIAPFSEQILTGIERRAGVLLDGYGRHVQEFLTEAPRSRGEHAMELLTLGMVLRLYEGAAQKTPQWIVELGRNLFWIRTRLKLAKPLADALRAGIARLFLSPRIGSRSKAEDSAVRRLAGLVEWLEATGEFEQESKRLNNWRSYLAELKPEKAAYWMGVAAELFDGFEREAAVALGAYTRGVEPFLAKEHARWGFREDLLFRGKPRVEYHLNMVAAEVMNQGLRMDFDRTAEKVVLVPTCMRGKQAETCKARVDGVDMTCTACDPECAVNRITRRMRRAGAKVYMVPHSSGFSRWLERWQRQPDTGVTAVACMLNILAGGYEMRALGIAAQCVMLDYPGCRKHWDRTGFPTAVNEDRLVQIVASPLRT